MRIALALAILAVSSLTVPSLASSNQSQMLSNASTRGDRKAAESICHEWLKETVKLNESDPRLLSSLEKIGQYYSWHQQGTLAEPLLRRAIDIRNRTPTQHLLALDLAADYYWLGLACQSEQKFADGEKFFQQSLTLREQLLDPGDAVLLTTMESTRDAHALVGNFTDALSVQKKIVENVKAVSLSTDTLSYLSQQAKLAEFSSLSGHQLEALSTADKVLSHLNNIGVHRNLSQVNAVISIAQVCKQNKMYKKAEKLLLEALSITRSIHQPSARQTEFEVNHALADLYLAWGGMEQFDKAAQFYSRCLSFLETAAGSRSPIVMGMLNRMALVDELRGRDDAAAMNHEKALSIAEEALGSDSAAVLDQLKTNASAYKQANNLVKLIQTQKRIINLESKLHGRTVALVDAKQALAEAEAQALKENRPAHLQAIQRLSAELRLHPAQAELYYARGGQYGEIKDYKHATADFSKAISIKPKIAKWYAARAECLILWGKSAQAICDCTRSIELNPKELWSYELRAVAELQLERDRAALDDLSHLLTPKPEARFVHWYATRAGLLKKFHRNDQALEDLNNAIQRFPRQADLYASRADLWELTGQHEKALKDRQQCKILSTEERSKKP